MFRGDTVYTLYTDIHHKINAGYVPYILIYIL